MSTTNQLLDSLTAHLALYSHSPSSPPPFTLPRASILRWFTSLSVPHRQSALSLRNPSLLLILLRMLRRLRSHGPSLFFLLPDNLESLDNLDNLPTLLCRLSPPLLRRSLSRNPHHSSLSRSVLLFSSSDGNSDDLDSVTVSAELVADISRFVGIMDGVSGGRFLVGEESAALADTWPELGWLKDCGYFSLEAFMGNWIEVALRLSWLSSKKLKGGRVGKEKVGAAGVAANGFWRMKGCVDWWEGLDPGGRVKMLQVFFGKSAKRLVNESTKWKLATSYDDVSCCKLDGEFRRRYGPTAYWQTEGSSVSNSNLNFHSIGTSASSERLQLAKGLFNNLLVVEEIYSLLTYYSCKTVDKTLFFSTLESVETVSDYILRKLRGTLMVISINYINAELLGDSMLTSVPSNSPNTGSRRRKNKSRNSRKQDSVPKATVVDPMTCNSLEDQSCGLDGMISRPTSGSVGILVTENEMSQITAFTSQKYREEEHGVGLPDSTGKTSKKKHKRKGAKSKIFNSTKSGLSAAEAQILAVPSLTIESKKVEGMILSSLTSYAENSLDESPASSSLDSCNKPNSIVESLIEIREVLNCSLTPKGCHADDCRKSLLNCEDHSSSQHIFASSAPFEAIPVKSIGCLAKDENFTYGFDCSIKALPDANGCRSVTTLPTYVTDSCTASCDKGNGYCSPEVVNATTLQPVITAGNFPSIMEDVNSVVGGSSNMCCSSNQPNHIKGDSYEWPRTRPNNSASADAHHLPAATDRLHLDVGQKWPAYFQQPFLSAGHQARNPSVENAHNCILSSLAVPMSFDWPPMVKSFSRLSQTVAVSYDSGYDSRLQPSFSTGFSGHGMQNSCASSDGERMHQGDIWDVYDINNASDLVDDAESYWLSEEDSEAQALPGRDYNQFFGGGIMYWNPTEHVGTGFSRPPSHSSEDSAWAWHEAELNRSIDDMVGMPGLSTSYNANGMASPPAAPFCSQFEPLGPALQSVGYAVQASELSAKVVSSSSVSDSHEDKTTKSLNISPNGVDGVKGDALQYPILRPIIVPGMSRRGSRSEFKPGYDQKNLRVSSRRDPSRIKRPPSPVVLCVPRVPRPPPPSPVGESRKRGFPIVRSGSSSPRHWGMRNWYSDESSSEDIGRLCFDGAEVVWPKWATKGVTPSRMVQSVPRSLLSDQLLTISQLTCDQEHPDVALPLQPPDLSKCPSRKAHLSAIYNLLHEEIDLFCKKVAAENIIKTPYVNWAVKRVTRSLQVLWPRSRTNIFGSNATGLALPTSDVDLVVSLPPVRNLEPIKEAGILEGRNGIKETCLQHAARYLANQEWVKSDSLKTIENTMIPIIMLVAEVPHDIDLSSDNFVIDMPQAHSTKVPGKEIASPSSELPRSEDTAWTFSSKTKKEDLFDTKSIRLDISFKSPSHTGLQTSELVRELAQQFPASVPLSLVLKKFLADRSLDHSYSGGLSSYCLVLLIIRFLQHEHHLGRTSNQNLGSLLMDFLYFFGNVFDPRQMRISIHGSGLYMNRERGLSIDPLHIDDPLYPTNNVGRNCFRVHQCIKAFADAYSVLENELPNFSSNSAAAPTGKFGLLQKIIPSIEFEDI